MAGDKERALFTRLLRESVLTLCREAMDSHRRFMVDGIVCISLEDDDDDDSDNNNSSSSGSDCSPIVVKIHEPLSKVRDSDMKLSRLRDSDDTAPVWTKPAGCGGAGALSPPVRPLPLPHPPVSLTQDGRSDLSLGKKTLLLRRALQAQRDVTPDEVTRDDVTRDDVRRRAASSPLDPVLTSEDVPRKVARLQDRGEEGEEEEEEGGTMGGHCSDPTPLRRVGRKGVVKGVLGRHSLSQSSDGSDHAPSWRSLPSPPTPTTAALSSPTLRPRDVRAGSASPLEEDTSGLVPFPFPPHPRPRPPGDSRYGSGRLTCRRCRLDVPDLLSLDRHNRQSHALFTCHQCTATFTTCNNLKRHARLHSGLKPFKCPLCSAAFSRRDDLKSHRQRHYNQPHHPHRHGRTDARRWQHDHRCHLCAYVGGSAAELRKHVLTHSAARSRLACGPCGLTFLDPLTYTAHLKLHSSDPEFRHYACCLCPAVLASHRLFLAHQHSHMLQHSSFMDCGLCGKTFRSPDHLRYHMATHNDRLASHSDHLASHSDNLASHSDHLASHSDHLAAHSDNLVSHSDHLATHRHDSGPPPDRDRIHGGLQPTPTDNGAEDEAEREGEEEEEEEEEGSGPRQSWCTECQLGFPDEDSLIQHIAVTHEAMAGGRLQEEEEEEEGQLPAGAGQSTQGDRDRSEHGDSDECRSPEGRHSSATRSDNTEEEAAAEREKASERNEREKERGEEEPGEEECSESEEVPKGLSTRSETMVRPPASHCPQDASSAATAPSALASVASSGKSSPLRVVPLSLAPEEASEDGAHKTTSQMVLVKPRDLFTPRARSPPPLDLPSLTHESDRAAEGLRDRMLRYPHCSERAGDRAQGLVDNFLHVKRSAYSLLYEAVLPSAPLSAYKARVKQEPLTDHDDPPAFPSVYSPRSRLLPHHPHLPHSHREAGGDPLGQGQGHEPPDLSPDLPTDLSMGGGSSSSSSSSPSPRSLCSDAARPPSFEKVVTPEVLFRARSPLQCTMAECGQRFPAYSQLEEHSARVHRRHLCEYCGKSFTAKPNRDRHVRYHTGVKPYKCSLCSLAFYRGDDLKYHRTTKHARETGY